MRLYLETAIHDVLPLVTMIGGFFFDDVTLVPAAECVA